MELEKDGWDRWTRFGVMGLKTLDFPTVNWNPR